MNIIDFYSQDKPVQIQNGEDVNVIHERLDSILDRLNKGEVVLDLEEDIALHKDNPELQEKIARIENLNSYQCMGPESLHNEVIDLFHHVRKGHTVPDLDKKMEGIEMRLKQLEGDPKLKAIQHKLSVIKIILLAPEKQIAEAEKQNLSIKERQIAKGAAKVIHAKVIAVPVGKEVVYVPIGETVRIVPVNGIQYFAKKEELIQELNKMEKIKDELEKPENVNQREQDKIKRLCRHIKQDMNTEAIRSESFNDFLVDFEDSYLSEDEKEAIRNFLADPRNKLLIETLKDSDHHLALDTKGQEGEPLEAERAVGDLGTVLKNYDLTMAERAALCYCLLDGLANLHSTGKEEGFAGNVHGDQKPDNVLIYVRVVDGKRYFTAKIADFGKTKKVPEKTLPNGEKRVVPLHSTGNPRLRPTENALTLGGDVEPLAFILIGTLEGPFLDKDGRLEKFPYQKGSKRKGLENTLCASPDCTQKECNINAKRIIDYITTPYLITDPKILIKAENVKHSYISTLSNKMQAADEENKEAIEQMEALLKDMTQANPSSRSSAKEALDRFPLQLLRE